MIESYDIFEDEGSINKIKARFPEIGGIQYGGGWQDWLPDLSWINDTFSAVTDAFGMIRDFLTNPGTVGIYALCALGIIKCFVTGSASIRSLQKTRAQISSRILVEEQNTLNECRINFADDEILGPAGDAKGLFMKTLTDINNDIAGKVLQAIDKQSELTLAFQNLKIQQGILEAQQEQSRQQQPPQIQTQTPQTR